MLFFLAWLGPVGMLLLAPVQVQAAGPDTSVTVAPEETDEILANPGMGWETFHKTAKQDKNLPAWIPSTIHYARWGWKVLEPEQGKINYDFLDGILKETRESGQQLAFRVMCCSPYPRRTYHPEWLRDIGGEIVKTRHGDSSEVEVPVLDDPKTLMAGTNRLKSDDEIAQAAVKGLDAITPRLDDLKEGQYVFLKGRRLNEQAPEDQAKNIIDYCREIKVKVQP
jgi:hypothetical protein